MLEDIVYKHRVFKSGSLMHGKNGFASI